MAPDFILQFVLWIMLAMVSIKDVNIAFRKLLIEFSEYYPSQVIKASQVEAPTTPDEFIAYDLTNQEMEPYSYQLDELHRVNYLLTYTVNIYGEYAADIGMRILQGFQTQAAKDILQPINVAYKSGHIIAIITENINNKGYNRADISLVLSALVQQPQPGHISQVNYNIQVK